MVLVLPGREKKPSFGEKIAEGLGQTLQNKVDLMQNQELAQQRAQKIQQLTGMDVSGMSDKQQDLVLSGYMKNLGQKEKNQQDFTSENERTETVRKYFGDEAAEIYKVAPEGGKTQIINHLLESSQRKEKFSDRFAKEMSGISEKVEESAEPKASEELEKPSIATKDFDKGLTPKERAARQDKRYTTNLPLYQESLKKYQTHQADADNLNILEDLSPQINFVERFNINPMTGELLIPGAASAEAQRYVKTLNDFTKNAKDSYGARVTNFDLTQFLKRLPTLANSEEGRRQIIEQLKIINDINLARESALQDVLDEHGGIRNIDFDEAERLADKMASKDINRLKGEFKAIGSSTEKSYQSMIKEFKKNTPPDKVPVMRPDGTPGYIPKANLKRAIDDHGYEVL